MDKSLEDFIFETAIFKLVNTYSEKVIGNTDNEEYVADASYLQVINDSIVVSENEKELNTILQNKIVNILEDDYGHVMAHHEISKLEFLSSIEIEIILKRKEEASKRLSKHYYQLPFAI